MTNRAIRHSMNRPSRPAAVAFLALLVCAAPARAAVPECAACHDTQATAVAKSHSPHAALGCIGCHAGREVVPHPSHVAKPQACVDCHATEGGDYKRSVHGLAAASGNEAAPDCQACHGDAHSVETTQNAEFRKGIGGLCGGCHSQEAENYGISIHGTAAARGVV